MRKNQPWNCWIIANMAAGRLWMLSQLAALQRMSTRSGVNIIVSTGYHLPMFYPEDHPIHFAEKQELEDIFLEELSEKIRDPGLKEPYENVKAGMVKAAIPAEGPIGRYEVLLRAAASSAAKMSVPLMLHTEKGKSALAAICMCEMEGLPAKRMLVCHVDRQATDYTVHEEIARTGAFLEYDTIHRLAYHDDKSEYKLIHYMINAGYAGQLLFSLDTTAKRLNHYGGEIGLSYLLRTFLPALQSAGVPGAVLHQIAYENPISVFCS